MRAFNTDPKFLAQTPARIRSDVCNIMTIVELLDDAAYPHLTQDRRAELEIEAANGPAITLPAHF